MSKFLKNYRFIISRRVVQIGLLLLYILSSVYGLNILRGNLSSSKFLDTIPLTDPYAFLQMLIGSAVIRFDILLGSLIVFIFWALIGGRGFCSWICPMNMVEDLADWLRSYIISEEPRSKEIFTKHTRYWILLISLILSFIFGMAAFEFVSPISVLHRGIIFGFSMAAFVTVLLIFVFDLFVLKSGWCGHLCPLGAFYSISGRYGIVSVKYDDDACTHCMKCKNICPEPQLFDHVGKGDFSIDGGVCTNCGRCIEVCDESFALKFGVRKYKKS